MSMRTLSRSFGGGEVSPLLYGRMDLAKNQTGLALCKNFRVTPQGPVENRPGFEFVAPCKFANQASVLIPFSYNSEQTFVLEFGNQYVRFHTLGGTLLESAKAISSIVGNVVNTTGAHGYTTGDYVFLGGRYYSIIVTSATAFQAFDPWTGLAGAPAGTSVQRVYEVVTPYVPADLFDLHYVQSADVLTIVHPSYATRELRRLGATNWTLTGVTFAPTITAPAAPTTAVAGPGGGTATSHTYLTTAVAAGTLEESLASPAASQSWDLTIAGNTVDVTPQPVAGAVRYNIYKYLGGVYGYIGQSDGNLFSDDNITADMTKTPPLSNTPLTGAGNFPRAASYHEQRRCFGGTTNKPQSMWMTRSGTESNMTYSIPTQDDDQIEARIVAREANAIRHLVPLGDLLALTAGGVWRIASTDSGAITPNTFSAKPQSYTGASNAQPVATSSSVLFAADRGAHFQEATFKASDTGGSYYTVQDISVIAPHLVDYQTIKQMTYAKAPVATLWAVRGDGALLGLTHVPEHDVRAWHQHDTDGTFESVCAVAEGTEDGVYVIVQRTINGQQARYVERLHSRHFAGVMADAFFVDCGLTYSGVAATTISGLWFLEGESVAVLADGVSVGPKTVTGGAITLTAAASKVQVGLAYTCDLQTLPLASETLAAFGHGVVKNINSANLRVLESSVPQVGPAFDKLVQMRGSASLVSSVPRVVVPPKWQDDGSICVRQSNPVPIMIVSMSTEVELGG